MLQPSRTKWRKQRRAPTGDAKRGTTLAFGEYGLQAVEAAWVTNRQIEAARVALTRRIKRGGKVWVRIFPDKPITTKPAETRMGGGKGAIDHWVCVVKPGRVLYEIEGVSAELAEEACRLAAHKLPCRTKFVIREGHVEE